MAWSMSPPYQISAVGLDPGSLFISSSSSSFPSLLSLSKSPCSSSYSTIASLSFKTGSVQPWILPFYKTPLSSSTQLVCRASEYQFPDPIPEFASAETDKFRAHLMKKLSKKRVYGDSLEEVVNVCTEIFSNFLHTEYGGPGTLVVIPFMDMADTVTKRGLPGGPQAARAAVKWAENHVDKDWKEWTGGSSSSSE